MFRHLLLKNPDLEKAFNDEFPDPLDKTFVEEALSGKGRETEVGSEV